MTDLSGALSIDSAAPRSDAAQTDPKRELARSIYTAWRNARLNNLPVEAFNRVEAASAHLVAAIAERL
jgi:hypothetical protein